MRHSTGLILLCGFFLVTAAPANAQMTSLKPVKPEDGIETNLLSSIGLAEPQFTPVAPDIHIESLPVKILYDGPKLEGDFIMEVVLSRTENSHDVTQTRPVTKTTLYIPRLTSEIDTLLHLPSDTNGLQLNASIRDSNHNLVLETPFLMPVLSLDTRILRLSAPKPTETEVPDFTSVETISGQISIPAKSNLPPGSILHIQLLENALAGGVTMELIAETSKPARLVDGQLQFELQRGLWDRQDAPDMSLKAWITDRAGRKIFVMNTPAGYNGPDIEYDIKLESLRQGRNTKRGANLSAELMAQTLIQGEATFDPVIGIPGQARLNIKLKQDRGDFNRNPTLAEQTLILRGMETRIPFALTTDSTHFDPYAPAPFLSVSLTDINGRIFYTSGEIRAREDKNFVQLYPR